MRDDVINDRREYRPFLVVTFRHNGRERARAHSAKRVPLTKEQRPTRPAVPVSASLPRAPGAVDRSRVRGTTPAHDHGSASGLRAKLHLFARGRGDEYERDALSVDRPVQPTPDDPQAFRVVVAG